MTFERQLRSSDQPRFHTTFPRPGDSPVYRPPVPLAPRTLRYVEPTLPLLVPPHIASPHGLPSNVLGPDSHPTDSTQGAHSTTAMGTESTNETEILKGEKDEKDENKSEKCDG
ncbi:hypothetical protein N7517_004288 [Penicillium concentricum]|uniref:Uncharacterized protein n=1 Tax=Penicillium concentricum TaxID=293559 RepID=A0A9W9V832_9EURO|nr:uncharacterized protein N7517_004288 [Penicillium concentricum]KAJ5372282.1 hypothetical protein N7517_004288 [Penicillium concentricum]